MRFGKRAAYATLAWPPHALVYAVAPLLLSRVGNHSNAGPSLTRAVGLVFVAAGAGLIAWTILSHYRASPDVVQFTAKPNYLVTTGAYGVTRNPLYVGGLAMWAGWAILFRNPLVAAVGGMLLIGLAVVGIPSEERMLNRAFGNEYEAYCRRVPRWLAISLRP